MPWARASRGSSRVSGSGFPGWGGPAASASPAGPVARTLCERAEFTGYTRDGGYAEYCVADARYCFALPADDAQAAAPLLCAGLVGYRTWRLAGAAVLVP